MEKAKRHEREGRPSDALTCYQAAAEAARATGEQRIEAETYRRLAVVHHHRNEGDEARELATRSFALAQAIGDELLAGEALNVLAGFDFEGGHMEQARARFLEALERSEGNPALRGRVEQNLGILANIQGDHARALSHYARSLEAFERSGDEKGRAIAYHNLGMVSADRGRWDDADAHFHHALDLARAAGDVHLTGLCLLNHSEVHVARQRFDDARHNAETALGIFDQLGARLDKADAYKVLGMVYRETGRHALAESRLRTAIEMAVSTGSVLSEAEASRELARLYQGMGRNQDALQLLSTAHRLFSRIDARVDLVDVASKVHRLQETYFAVVREWGQSIESSDSYTFGHCERVARYGEAVARGLGLDDGRLTTVRMGAYLHDLGKVRVPHEILNKPGPLTLQEFEVIKQHPNWGIDLLSTVEFPWDIKPIIRWHHERCDGTGYPDGLEGDEIPLGAQII
ncbi:MAG TPA: tetratricopeptide repeat protein, partial [Gemmatimonadales bacterium]|nr:tetratricopeptide repeat protein [Gemmatimonadales bacterium]